MKKFILITLFLGNTLCGCLNSMLGWNIAEKACAQEMIVHLKNGQQVQYSIQDVERVEVKTPETPAERVDGLSGTIATPVDLGLSVLWASHNLGAACPTDDGCRLVWNDTEQKVKLWGEGWRLPTAAEWFELYTSCKWKWEFRDGIGGRLITADNGASIFIPASGMALDDKVAIKGGVGIYWTSDAVIPAEFDVTSPRQAMGAYFDSANIYSINYPTQNALSIRLVKSKP